MMEGEVSVSQSDRENILNSIKIIHLKTLKDRGGAIDGFFRLRTTDDLIIETLNMFNEHRTLTLKTVYTEMMKFSLEGRNKERTLNTIDDKYGVRKIILMMEDCGVITRVDDGNNKWYNITWEFTPHVWKEKFDKTKEWILKIIKKKIEIIENSKILFKCSRNCTRDIYIFSKSAASESYGRCPNGHKLIPINKKAYGYLYDEYKQFEAIKFPEEYLTVEEPEEIESITEEIEGEEEIMETSGEMDEISIHTPSPISIGDFSYGIKDPYAIFYEYLHSVNLLRRDLYFISRYHNIAHTTKNDREDGVINMEMKKRRNSELIRDLAVQYWHEVASYATQKDDLRLRSILTCASASKKHVWMGIKDKLKKYGVDYKNPLSRASDFFKDLDEVKADVTGKDKPPDDAYLLYKNRHLRLGPKGIDQYLRILLMRGEKIRTSDLKGARAEIRIPSDSNILELIKKSESDPSFTLPEEEYPEVILDTEEAVEAFKNGNAISNVRVKKEQTTLHDNLSDEVVVDDVMSVGEETQSVGEEMQSVGEEIQVTESGTSDANEVLEDEPNTEIESESKDESNVDKDSKITDLPVDLSDEELEIVYKKMYGVKVTRINGIETKPFKKFKERYSAYVRLKNGRIIENVAKKDIDLDDKLLQLFNHAYPNKKSHIRGKKTKLFEEFESDYGELLTKYVSGEVEEEVRAEVEEGVKEEVEVEIEEEVEEEVEVESKEETTIDENQVDLDDESDIDNDSVEVSSGVEGEGEDSNSTDAGNVKEEGVVKETIATVKINPEKTDDVSIDEFIGMCNIVMQELLREKNTVVFNAEQFLNVAEKLYPNFSRIFFKLFMDYTPIPAILKVKNRTVTYVVDRSVVNRQTEGREKAETIMVPSSKIKEKERHKASYN